MKKFKKKDGKRIVIAIIFSIIVIAIVIFSKTAKWNTYTSSSEKLSFEYPSSWQVQKSRFPLPIGSATSDAFTLTSPTGKVKISWVGAITGLGGGCDQDTVVEARNKGCGLFEIVEKDKIPNTNLYFVEYLFTQDGINYTPRFALQDDIVANLDLQRGYLFVKVFTFQGRNNYITLDNGSKEGPFQAVFSGGEIFQRQQDKDFPSGSKEDMRKYFSDPEVIQAKQIMLSVNYK